MFINVVKFETKYAQWNRTRAQKHHVFRSERFNLLNYQEPKLFGVNIDHYDRLWFSKFFVAKFKRRAKPASPKDTILIYFFEQKLSKYLLGAGRLKNLEICTKENNKKL